MAVNYTLSASLSQALVTSCSGKLEMSPFGKLEMSPFGPSETTLLGWFNEREIEDVRGANNHERKGIRTIGSGSQNS